MVTKTKTSLKDRVLECVTNAGENGITAAEITRQLKGGESSVYAAIKQLKLETLPKRTNIEAARFIVKPDSDKSVESTAEMNTQPIRRKVLEFMPKDGKEVHVDQIAEAVGKETGAISAIISVMTVRYKELARLRRGYYKITPRGISALTPEPEPVVEEECNQSRWTTALKARYNGFFEAIVKAAISRLFLDNVGFQDDFMDCYRWAERKVLLAAVEQKTLTKVDADSLMRQPKNMQALIGLAYNVENEIIRIQTEELDRLTAKEVRVDKVGDASLCATEDIIAVLLQRGRTVMQAISGLPSSVTQNVTAMLSGLTLTPALHNPAAVEPAPAPVKKQTFKIGIVGLFEHEMRHIRENTKMKALEIDGDLELVCHPDIRGKVNYRPDLAGVVICNGLATSPMITSARSVFARSLIAQTKQAIPDKVLELLKSLQEQAEA